MSVHHSSSVSARPLSHIRRLLAIAALPCVLLAACDTRVNTPPAETNTTIVNPPAQKTEEHNTTVVAPQPTKTESTTNTVTTPGGSSSTTTTEKR